MSRAVCNGVMEACGVHKIKVDPFSKGFDMGLARPLSRSVRLNGFSTCLRLEQIYWNILTEIARLNACSVSALLSYVDREVHLRYGGGEELQRFGQGGVRGSPAKGACVFAQPGVARVPGAGPPSWRAGFRAESRLRCLD